MGWSGLGSAGSAVGPDDLKDLFQLKQFCDPMIEQLWGLNHGPVLCRKKVVSLKETFSECRSQFPKCPALAVVWGSQT